MSRNNMHNRPRGQDRQWRNNFTQDARVPRGNNHNRLQDNPPPQPAERRVFASVFFYPDEGEILMNLTPIPRMDVNNFIPPEEDEPWLQRRKAIRVLTLIGFKSAENILPGGYMREGETSVAAINRIWRSEVDENAAGDFFREDDEYFTEPPAGRTLIAHHFIKFLPITAFHFASPHFGLSINAHALISIFVQSDANNPPRVDPSGFHHMWRGFRPDSFNAIQFILNHFFFNGYPALRGVFPRRNQRFENPVPDYRVINPERALALPEDFERRFNATQDDVGNLAARMEDLGR